MGSTEFSGGRKPDGQAKSVAFGEEKPDLLRPQSSSSASSGCTKVVERVETLNTEARIAPIKRRQTQVPVVKLSWWDCVKAVFKPGGLKTLKQKLAATVQLAELDDADERMFRHRECPYVLTVSVYEYQSSGERQDAQCVLDTGCFQGNIISQKLANRLGFTDFQELNAAEKTGGKTATGIHEVLGAIHVSWLHSTSPKIFRDMRFLVSESEHIELIIGTHSITRHQLIPPPNLFIDLDEDSDTDRETLSDKIAQLKKDMKKAEREGNEKLLKKKTKEHETAVMKLDLYDTSLELKREKSDKTKKALKDKAEGLKTALKNRESKKKASNEKSDTNVKHSKGKSSPSTK